MSKLILKLKGIHPLVDRTNIENQILNDLEKNGFVLLDDSFEVYEIDEKENK